MKRLKPTGFNIWPTKKEIVSSYEPATGKWSSLRFVKWGYPLTKFSSKSAALNYAETIFEGLKCHLNKEENSAIILHLKENAERFENSAKGMAMPPFPKELFMEAARELIILNQDYIPRYKEGALYIRPVQGGEESLGVKKTDHSYKTVFWCSPIGHYSKGPVDCFVTDKIRSVAGGLGKYKTSANYQIAKLALIEARNYDCEDVIFTDQSGKIQEFSVMNLFYVKNDLLFTPKLDGTILPGLTREVIIKIIEIAKLDAPLRAKEVTEKQVFLEELFFADEVFGCGTAADIIAIKGFKTHSGYYKVGKSAPGPVTQSLLEILNALQVNEIPQIYQGGKLEDFADSITEKIPLKKKIF